MMDWQDMVREFHRKMGQPAPDSLDFEDLQEHKILRAELISEESVELYRALGLSHDGKEWLDEEPVDVVETIDAICDLLYVTLGLAVTMGLPVDMFFDEVHRSNMTKTPGNTRGDGKILKGPGFSPPRIRDKLDLLKVIENG